MIQLCKFNFYYCNVKVQSMGKRIFIIIISLFFVVLVACKQEIHYSVDVSKINLELPFYRFDKELYQIPNDSLSKKAFALINRYPQFMQLYAYRIIKIGNPYSKDFASRLQVFKSDYVVSNAYDVVEKKFVDMSAFEHDLTNAFKCYHYYFPKHSVPKVYTFVSGFNQAIVVDSNLLGIGLDFYLGSQCKYYRELAFPRYIIEKMNANMMLHDALWGWLTAEFPISDTENNLLANMIYYGKIQYALNTCLPIDYPDSLKFGIESDKLNWCVDNEEQMWTYFVEKKLLFSQKYLQIKKFIDEAPFTTPFGQQSPARTGVWIGTRIVEAYMKNNPSVSLEQLMAEKNFQKILTLSQYNP